MTALKAAGIVLALTAGGIGGVGLLPRSIASPTTFPTPSPYPSETMPPNGWVRRIRIGESKAIRYDETAAIELWTDCAQNHIADVAFDGSVATYGTEARVTGRGYGECHLVAYALDGWSSHAVRAVLTISVGK